MGGVWKKLKYEILEPIQFNKKVEAGDVIVKLKNRNIIAPFEGVIGKRNFSDDIKVSESSLVINLEDASTLFVDVDIPEVFSSNVNKGLRVDIKFSGNKDKSFEGIVESLASRINTDTRSLAARIKLDNSNLEILPLSLIHI